jgi:hypothetical protein
MSKIALTPDASGTGTFTIASPNSNTNRTLTLPDASGEVFNQGNIVGTVSEASGVPTGAIIESGSNANGEFVKYADGTLICTVSAINGGSTWTFPVAFSSAPKMTNASVAGNNARFTTLGAPSTTSVATFGWLVSGSASTAASDLCAIGRWF